MSTRESMIDPHTLTFGLAVRIGAALLLVAAPALGQTPTRDKPGAADVIARIRAEGLERSQVMETVRHLTEVIGPRLTGSPQLRRANEWTRERLASWGLTNAQVEAWGTFGRGWSLKRFSAQVIAPYAFPVIAYPKAWSPGLARPFVGEVVYLDAQ